MKVLGIETSTYVGSVSLLDGSDVVGEFLINVGPRHSEKLLPMIEEMLKLLEVDKRKIGGISVTIGPGFFTALRVGIATAKGLAYALGIPIVGVCSLEVLASNLSFCSNVVCSVIDAKRGEFYASFVRFEDGEIARRTDTVVDTPVGLMKRVTGKTVFVGDTDGLKELGVNDLVEFVPLHYNIPRASVCARIGARKLELGLSDEVASLAPIYARKAEAEIIKEGVLG
ncbi:MAG: tRNA (adenosine(37)-N6)-threonylcarbamoyltransferase complex dimerization subunit type 1 TsaB [Candidatus Dadabacteria bacterium]|nr:tRNA (adenosine(37)-N6)-threonylcarbamoyltransferase complex dimerization subunit type 1 TsaB [Candidatus Dadabacteria bacterium]